MISFSKAVVTFLATVKLPQRVHAACPTNSVGGSNTNLQLELSTTADGFTAYHESGTSVSFPSPTICFNRCQTYHLSLTNNLNEDTNLHTHGLHISGQSVADDVVDVTISPGGSHTYTYHVPCHHASGTHWYHPHPHGLTDDQLSAGAAGALIINDPQNKENIDATYLGMDEYLFLAQDTSSGFFVNGESNPSFSMNVNEWTRFRIIHASPNAKDVTWSISDPACEVQLLAKDGVYLEAIPRQVNPFFIGTVSSRADVAVRCTGAGSISIDGGGGAIATLQVTSGQCAGYCEPTLPSSNPCRPVYLEDMSSTAVDSSFVIRMGASNFRIDGTSYSYPSNPTGPSIPVEGSYEIDLSGTSAHPLHFHVNHVQLQDDKMTHQDDANWHLPGDWLDTVNGSNGLIVRFKADLFTGKMVLHCHISKHSDNGAIAWLNVAGSGNEGSSLYMGDSFC